MATLEFSNYIETRQAADTPDGTEKIVVSQNGESRQMPLSAIPGSGTRPAFSNWDPSGDSMPLDADGIGSGALGAILKGDQVIFTDKFPDGGNDWPVGTIGIAKQDSPTLTSHWRLY